MREVYGSYYPANPKTGGMPAVHQRIDFVWRDSGRREESDGVFHVGSTRRLDECARCCVRGNYDQSS